MSVLFNVRLREVLPNVLGWLKDGDAKTKVTFPNRPRLPLTSFSDNNIKAVDYRRLSPPSRFLINPRASWQDIDLANAVIQNGPFPKPTDLFSQRDERGLLQNRFPLRFDLNAIADTAPFSEVKNLSYRIWKQSGLPSLAHNIALAEGEISPLHSEGLASRSLVELPVYGAYNHAQQKAMFFQRPYVPANMKTVTDAEFARRYVEQGGVPALRYINSDLGRDERRLCAKHLGEKVIITIRTNSAELKEAEHLYNLGARFFCVEMANAFSPQAMETIRHLRKTCPEATLVAGNVATPEGYIFLSLLKVGAVKCGRGSGAACTTPEVTGQGVRQFTANWEMGLAQLLMDKWFGYDIPFWSDGGAKGGADVFKALWAGSGPVMMGSAFAAVYESAAFKKQFGDLLKAFYFGEASDHAARIDGGEGQRTKAQGSARWLTVTGSLEEFINGLDNTVKSALADAGVISAEQFTRESAYRSEFKLETLGAGNEKNTRGENGEDSEHLPRLVLPSSW